MKLVVAHNINGSGHDGVIDVDGKAIVCLCLPETAQLIVGAFELLDKAAGLVGNPGTGISSSCDIACDNWQLAYESWKAGVIKSIPVFNP